jgi:hypothetical protein
VRALDGEVEVRAIEVEATMTTYTAEHVAVDFPGGLGTGSRVAVAQWGDGYGWGSEAFAVLDP